MNQILVRDKLYVTNKLKKKKQMYKIEFIVSIILVFVFSGCWIFSEFQKNSAEAVSQEILSADNLLDNIQNVQNSSNTQSDETTSNEPLVVAMEDIEIVEEPEIEQPVSNRSYTDKSGKTYTYESIISIPSLGIEYPVLSETSDELLEISINKFWGGSPNSVGNYCVVGHNYKSGKMFGKLSQIKTGDIVKLTDLSGNTLNYKVYDRFVVYPDNVECTSQKTNGLKEMTLITCTNGGKQRLIVKCREAA